MNLLEEHYKERTNRIKKYARHCDKNKKSLLTFILPYMDIDYVLNYNGGISVSMKMGKFLDETHHDMDILLSAKQKDILLKPVRSGYVMIQSQNRINFCDMPIRLKSLNVYNGNIYVAGDKTMAMFDCNYSLPKLCNIDIAFKFTIDHSAAV